MSLSDRRSKLFLEPLWGKTTAFRLDDRASNLKFGAALIRLLSGLRQGCMIVDLDAFYSSNLDALTKGVPREALADITLAVPEPGSNTETELAAVFLGDGDRPLLIDSANSLYQLLSARNPKAASRKFSFFVSTLSAWAKTNGRPVMASFYDRRPAIRRRITRSLADAFETSVRISTRPEGLAFRCERGSAWRDGSFFLPALEDGQVVAHEHGKRYE